MSKPGGGYDPTKFMPSPSQYVPGASAAFVPQMIQNTKVTNVEGGTACLYVGSSGTFPKCDPELPNGNCCSGLSCFENPMVPGDFRCANFLESEYDPYGKDTSKTQFGNGSKKMVQKDGLVAIASVSENHQNLMSSSIAHTAKYVSLVLMCSLLMISLWKYNRKNEYTRIP